MRAITMTVGLAMLGAMGCGKKDDAPAQQAAATASVSAAPATEREAKKPLADTASAAPTEATPPPPPSDPTPVAAGAYAAGDVLKHMPAASSCTKGRVFVDVSKLLKPDFAAQIDSKLAALPDEKVQQFVAVLKASGIRLATDTKEVAACIDDREHVTIAVGGNFSGKDLMGPLSKVIAALGDPSIKKEDVDGLAIINAGGGNGAFAQVEPNVLLFAAQKSDLLAAAKRVSRAAEWPTAGLMVWAQMIDRKFSADMQAVDKGDAIALKWIGDMKGTGAEKMKADAEGMKAEVKREIAKVAGKLDGSPFSHLADDLRAAKIEVDGTKLILSGTVSNAHVAEGLKALEEAMAVELGGSSTRPSGGSSRVAKLMDDAATKACACKDAKCAADAMKGIDVEIKKAMIDGSPSEADMKAVSAAAKKMADCTMKLAGATAPSTPRK